MRPSAGASSPGRLRTSAPWFVAALGLTILVGQAWRRGSAATHEGSGGTDVPDVAVAGAEAPVAAAPAGRGAPAREAPAPGPQRPTPKIPKLMPAVVAPRPAPLHYGDLLKERPVLGRTWSQNAEENRKGNLERLRACARSLVQRMPPGEDEEEADAEVREVDGNVAFTFEVSGGVARMEEIQPLRGCDQAFAECYASAATYAREPLDVPGEKDGTVTVEWPFTFYLRR